MPERHGTTYGELLQKLLLDGLLDPQQAVLVKEMLRLGCRETYPLLAHELIRHLVRAGRLLLRDGTVDALGEPLLAGDPRRGHLYRLPALLSSRNPSIPVPLQPSLGPPPRFLDREIAHLFEDQSRRLFSSVEQSSDLKGMIAGMLDLLRTLLEVPAALCFTEDLPAPAGIAQGMEMLPGSDLPSTGPADPSGGSPWLSEQTRRWRTWVAEAAQRHDQALYLPDLRLLPPAQRPLADGSALLVPLREHLPPWSVVLSLVTPKRYWFDAERLARLRFFTGHLRRQLTYAVALQTAVSIDFLTRVHNRAFFEEQLRRALAGGKRKGQSFALLLVDIDDFKQFNSRHGYDAGDRVLQAVADVIKRTLRTTDVIARYGGEEFAVLLAPPVSPEETTMVAERLRLATANLGVRVPDLNGSMADVGVTISIGGALFPAQGTTRDEIWSTANQLVLDAKAGGKNQVRLPWPKAD